MDRRDISKLLKKLRKLGKNEGKLQHLEKFSKIKTLKVSVLFIFWLEIVLGQMAAEFLSGKNGHLFLENR